MHLNVFQQQFCRLAKATDLAKYEEDFERKRKDTNILLRTIFTDAHWGIHQPFLALAKRMAVFAGSCTFANVFRKSCASYGKPVDVQGMGGIADMAMATYKRDCQLYYINYNMYTTVSNVEQLWENVSPDILFVAIFFSFCFYEHPIDVH